MEGAGEKKRERDKTHQIWQYQQQQQRPACHCITFGIEDVPLIAIHK